MKNVKIFAFLFPLACLLGCTLSGTPVSQTNASSPLTGNWQIQAGAAITYPPIAPYLVGAIEETGPTLTGIFSTAQSTTVSPAIDSYSGTYDAATSILSLEFPPPQIAGVMATLAVPSNPTTLSTGTLLFQCGLCNNGQLFSVVGAEIAPLNGTYTGTLSGTLITSSQTTPTPVSGTASLVLTQSTIPNSSAQFPLTGAVTFPSSTDLGTTTLPGLVSGVGIWLNDEPCVQPFGYPVCNVIGPGSTLRAYTSPTATQITVTSLNTLSDMNGTDTSVILTGTLTLQ